MSEVFSFMEPLLADIWGSVLHLDCVGLRGAYAMFILHVFALPVLFVGAALIYFAWQHRRNPADAKKQLPSHIFAAIFITYPSVSPARYSVIISAGVLNLVCSGLQPLVWHF